MSERVTEDHLVLLEHALDNIESEYTPACQSAPYGSGCPGATDESIDFWRRAADALPSLIAEVRQRRAADLTSEDREALRWAKEWLSLDGIAPRSETNIARHRRAISVLDRLLAEVK